jgi:hypothetical protein
VRADGTDAAIDAVCAAIRGIPNVWRGLTAPAEQSRFLAAAARHRLRPLIAARLRETGEWRSWPQTVRGALADAERAEAALEIARRQELSRLLAACGSADLPVLLIKGAALAYSMYPEPWLRPREDTDLVVRSSDAERADRVLRDCGFRPAIRQRGRLVTHQRLYHRADAAGRRDAYDLHWKIADPAPFADLLSVDDLLRDASTVAVGDRARARVPSTSHALLLACWHRVSHHHDAGDLLWLYDLHLLADRSSDADARTAIDIARRTGTGPICARGLRLAAERFGTGLPSRFIEELEKPDGAAPSLTVSYLQPDARKVDLLAADLKALPDWESRARLVREHLFPPAEYMFETYGRSNRMLLPVLYLWRIASGAPRWFRRS